MPFKPKRQPSAPDFKKLLLILNNSKVREKDTPLYEVVKRLLENGNQQGEVFNNEIIKVNQVIQELQASAGSGGGADSGSGGGPAEITGYYEPVTNGDGLSPEILFDSNGEVIMGFVSLG